MRRLYRLAGLCVLLFLAAQTFQAVAYWLWLPDPQSIPQDLVQRTVTVARLRDLLILFSIVGLLVPYVVIAVTRFRRAPMAAALGVIFGTLFVAAELFHRSIDFFVISMQWARDYQASSLARDVILQRYELWNNLVHGWYFPLLLAHFLASMCFAVATWREPGRWAWLAPAAFALNAVRLVGRLFSSFAGQAWLDASNGMPLYFILVAVINGMLAAWFFWSARVASEVPVPDR